MPVLCDFIQLVGDNPNVINPGEPAISFNTGGRESGSTAFLLFNIRRLRESEGSVNVRVNGTIVGSIQPYPASIENAWFAQMIAMTGTQINDGNNTVTFDKTGFEIKNMVCFFHQSA